MLGSTHNPAVVPTGAQVETLRKQSDKANRLTPDSIVTVINRGRAVLTRKWDAEDYDLRPYTHRGGTVDAPYLMAMPYAAALHFQRHCPVPGTRDPNSNDLASMSFLGILDTDPPEMCAPFADEECQQFGQAIEAIERAETDEVKVLDVKQLQRKRVGQSGLGNNTSRLPQTTTGEEADRAAADIAREAMRPPDSVSEEIQSEIAEGEAELAKTEGRGRRR